VARTENDDCAAPAVWIDGDACHVREEIIRVCGRYGIVPRLVGNKIPAGYHERSDVEMVAVPALFDAADDHIVEHLSAGDLVLTGDIPLAARVLKAAAHALDFRGRWFTEAKIGDLMAKREVNAFRRQVGEVTGGPSRPRRADRSLLLQELNNFLDRRMRGRD